MFQHGLDIRNRADGIGNLVDGGELLDATLQRLLGALAFCQFCGGLRGPNLDEFFEMVPVLFEFGFDALALGHITNDPLIPRLVRLAILPDAGSDERVELAPILAAQAHWIILDEALRGDGLSHVLALRRLGVHLAGIDLIQVSRGEAKQLQARRVQIHDAALRVW